MHVYYKALKTEIYSPIQNRADPSLYKSDKK